MPEDTARPAAVVLPLPVRREVPALDLVDLTPAQRAGDACVCCGAGLPGPRELVETIIHGGGRRLPLYACPRSCPAGDPPLLRAPGTCSRCGEAGTQLVVGWAMRSSGPDLRRLRHGDPLCAEGGR